MATRTRLPQRTALQAWRAFLEAHAEVTRLLEAEMMEERQLPLAWYDVLVQLAEAPRGRLRMQELARRVLLSKSGLTRLADRMEQTGYLRRQACTTDGRGVEAVLTPAGRAALRGAAPVHMRGVYRHFTSLLNEDDATAVALVMERVRDAARAKG